MTKRNKKDLASLREMMAQAPTQIERRADVSRKLSPYYFYMNAADGYAQTTLGATLRAVAEYEAATTARGRRYLLAGREGLLLPGDALEGVSSGLARSASYSATGLLDSWGNARADMTRSDTATAGNVDRAGDIMRRAFIALARPSFRPSSLRELTEAQAGAGWQLRQERATASVWRWPLVQYAPLFRPEKLAAMIDTCPFVNLCALLLTAQSFAAEEAAEEEARLESDAARTFRKKHGPGVHSLDFLEPHSWRAVAAYVGLVSAEGGSPGDLLGYVTIPNVVRGSRISTVEPLEWGPYLGETAMGLVAETGDGFKLHAEATQWAVTDPDGHSEAGGAGDVELAKRLAVETSNVRRAFWQRRTGRLGI